MYQKFIRLLLHVLVVVSGLRLVAWSEAVDYYYTLSLTDLMNTTVTGSTLTEHKSSKAPSSVTVITQDEISRLGLHTLEELMNYIPGFQSIRQSESSIHNSYSARARRIGTTGREILVLLNGMRLDNSWSGGLESTIPALRLSSIKRLEFIRGPGSAIYGSNAFLGVINIVTVIAEEDTKTNSNADNSANQLSKFKLSSGSHSFKDYYMQVKNQWGKNSVAGYLNYTKDNGDSFVAKNGFTDADTVIRDPFNSMESAMKYRYQWTTNQKTWMELIYTRKYGDDFYISDKISHDYNRSEIEYFNGYLAHNIRISKEVSSIIKMGVRRWIQNVAGQATSEGELFDFSMPQSRDPLLVNASLKDKAFWLKIDNDWQASIHHTYQYGFEFRHAKLEEAKAENNFDLADLVNGLFPVRYYGDFNQGTPLSLLQSRDISGLYLQYQGSYFNDIDFTAGVRIDDYQHIGSHVSPRLGAVYSYDDNQTFKLLYGEAFRAPGISELYAINNKTVAGNPALDPETVSTWELLWLFQNNQLNTSFGYFFSEISQSITQQHENTIRTFVNGKNEIVKGLETEVAYQLSENSLLKMNYSHIFDKPESSFRESDSTFSSVLDLQFSELQFNLSVYHHGVKEILRNDNSTKETLKSTWMANSKLSYRVSDEVTLSLLVKNLFNKEMFTPSQDVISGEGTPNRLRTWYFEFSYVH